MTLGEPAAFGAADGHSLVLAGALASKAEDEDAIDLAVIAALADSRALNGYTQSGFVPFDPVNKRTEGQITDADGKTFKVTKGAPQVVMALAKLAGEQAARAERLVDNFAAKGYRTLGVARSEDGERWTFLGILPLFDPPREDSKETIHQSVEHGIEVKMVTGDNVAIAREIAGRLELGTKIQPAGDLLA